jgi:hypothetical protein
MNRVSDPVSRVLDPATKVDGTKVVRVHTNATTALGNALEWTSFFSKTEKPSFLPTRALKLTHTGALFTALIMYHGWL